MRVSRPRRPGRTLLVASAAALILAGCGDDSEPVPAADVETIPLPDGFQPEGIALSGERFFVGSIATGAVYSGELASGDGELLVQPQDDRSAIGLAGDAHGRLLVAGGTTGQAVVYDAESGQEQAVMPLADGETFVNDVTVADGLAWFTDSRNPVLYRVELPPPDSPEADPAITAVPLSGDLRYRDGINANGIAITGDGSRLIVVQTNTGGLFTVDPDTGVSREVDLGDERLPGGDGIVLDGSTLYVAQNDRDLIAEVTLSEDLGSGTIQRRLAAEALDAPSTIAATGDRIYAVNARFGTEPAPDTSYEIISLPRP